MSRRQQLSFDLPHRPALGREDFLVAPCNAEALVWLDRWPEWPEGRLVVHGPEGAGKSHLAEVWRRQSGAAVLSPECLEEIAAEMPPPRAALLLDDAASAMSATREPALLHLLNGLREVGGTLLLTARTAPARWPVRLPDLASRLAASPTVGIGPPDDALLAAVLVKFFHERQVRVSGDVVHYLISRIERSFAAAQLTARALDEASLSGKRPITVALAREVLEVA
jgi:chromosomal replication initiation ATPase DnaA